MLSLWKDKGKLFDGVKSVRTAQSLHRIMGWFGWEWTLKIVPKVDPKQGSKDIQHQQWWWGGGGKARCEQELSAWGKEDALSRDRNESSPGNSLWMSEERSEAVKKICGEAATVFLGSL